MNRKPIQRLVAAFVISASLAAVASAQLTLSSTQARVGDTITIDVTGGHPNSVWMLGLDRTPGPTYFADLGLSVDLGFTSDFVAIHNQYCDSMGAGQISWLTVTDNSFAGVIFYAQALNVDPTNVFSISKSNPLMSVVHPSDPGVGTQSSHTLGDDDSALVSLGFTFPFYDQSYTQVYVNSNGSVSFGQPNTSFIVDESLFLGGTPTVAPFFADLNPSLGGTVVSDTTATPGQAFSVRFTAVDDNLASGPNTFTVTLFVGGHIAFDFGSIGLTDGIISGITPGMVSALNNIDLSMTSFSAFGAPLSIYETFSVSSPFDLSGSQVLFGRVGTAGYAVMY